MSMVGDGPEGQPTEGVDSLASIASAMEGSDESAPVESEEEGEDSGETEEVEAEEEEADEPEEEEEQEEPTVTIKHDGKDVTLKQSELVEMAQKGFDYSQKTMAVAEERKAVEAVRKSYDELRTQGESYLKEQEARLTAIAQFAYAQVGEPPDITLAQTDAAQYLAQKHWFDQRQGQLQQALAGVRELQEEAQRQRQAHINRTANETEEALRSTLPGWNDEMLADYAKYADGLGLNPQTAAEAFVQKGFWQLIHKAKAFDALQEKRAQIKPKSELPKVAAPKASNPTPRGIVKRQEAHKRYRESPSLNTLAALVD